MAKYYNADTLLEFVKNNTPTIDGQTTLQCVERAIKEAPTADVKEVKRGHWEEVQYTYFGLKRYVCSECSDDEYWEKRYLEHKESFCPNCGADMRGDTNDL